MEEKNSGYHGMDVFNAQIRVRVSEDAKQELLKYNGISHMRTSGMREFQKRETNSNVLSMPVVLNI